MPREKSIITSQILSNITIKKVVTTSKMANNQLVAALKMAQF